MKQKLQRKQDAVAMLRATIKSIRRDGSEYKNPQRAIMTLTGDIMQYNREIREIKAVLKKCK